MATYATYADILDDHETFIYTLNEAREVIAAIPDLIEPDFETLFPIPLLSNQVDDGSAQIPTNAQHGGQAAAGVENQATAAFADGAGAPINGEDNDDDEEIGGYSYKFVDDVVDYECAFCICVVKDPRLIVTCGHSFCRTCLNLWIINSGIMLRCPTDKITFNRSDVVPDKRLARIVGGLKVYCKNVVLGCGTTPELRDLESHTKKCPCEILKTQNDEMKMLVAQLRNENEHLRDKFRQEKSKSRKNDVKVLIARQNKGKVTFLESFLSMGRSYRYIFRMQIEWRENDIDIDGPAFYTHNGYKMYVNVWGKFDGQRRQLLVRCFLMKGANDAELQWPWNGPEYMFVYAKNKVYSVLPRGTHRVNQPGSTRPDEQTNEHGLFYQFHDFYGNAEQTLLINII